MARRFVELGARGHHLRPAGGGAGGDGGGVRPDSAAGDAKRCDVRDNAAVEAMIDRIWARAPLDVLVNNAAGNFLAQSHRLSPRAVDAVLDIVLKGSA